ncbi:MAG: ArsA-related P-loop ATPase [Acidimicrobiales bacterium]
MDRLFPATRRVNKVVGPVLKRVAGVPTADDRASRGRPSGSTTSCKPRRCCCRTRHRASVRLVVNLERIVIAEARRTYTYLSLFGYAADAVVANRALPASVADPFFDRWKTPLQAGYLDDIADAFAVAGAAGRPGRRRARRPRGARRPSAPSSTGATTSMRAAPPNRCSGCTRRAT